MGLSLWIYNYGNSHRLDFRGYIDRYMDRQILGRVPIYLGFLYDYTSDNPCSIRAPSSPRSHPRARIEHSVPFRLWQFSRSSYQCFIHLHLLTISSNSSRWKSAPVVPVHAGKSSTSSKRLRSPRGYNVRRCP